MILWEFRTPLPVLEEEEDEELEDEEEDGANSEKEVG